MKPPVGAEKGPETRRRTDDRQVHREERDSHGGYKDADANAKERCIRTGTVVRVENIME
jgi:hypothetical protein